MNCQECSQKLSAFMDSDLDVIEAAAVRDHLAVCSDCALACTNLASMLDMCNEASADELRPNESKQLWLRITNVIENEVKPSPPPRTRFTLLRVATAMAGIAIVSSVLTVATLHIYETPSVEEFGVRTSTRQTTIDKVLSRLGLVDSPQAARERRIKEQQTAIEYWNARVQARRTQWDARTREAFDRNLRVIDESLVEYSTILARDPEDELSGEMLDSVMHEKMDLLRDFADL